LAMCHQISMQENTAAHHPLFDHDGNQYSNHHNLLLAVLHRSILDYLDDTRDRKVASVYSRGINIRLEAEHYLFKDTPNDHLEPFSFAWIAEHVATDPEGFIEGIRRRLKDAPKRREVRETLGLYANRFRKGIGANWRTEA
jgi:hypothetical protein